MPEAQRNTVTRNISMQPELIEIAAKDEKGSLKAKDFEEEPDGGEETGEDSGNT